jgi:hypothetical protein
MAIQIEKKIVDYSVRKEDEQQQAAAANEAEKAPVQDNVVQLHEKLKRPDMLIGSTYKVKTPLSEHALYVTIIRDLHQLQEHGPLPVDRGADADYFRGLQEGR